MKPMTWLLEAAYPSWLKGEEVDTSMMLVLNLLLVLQLELENFHDCGQIPLSCRHQEILRERFPFFALTALSQQVFVLFCTKNSPVYVVGSWLLCGIQDSHNPRTLQVEHLSNSQGLIPFN